MDQYELHDWTLSFGQATSQAGLCDRGKKVIRLSAPLMLLWTEDQCRDIVLHEIAHVLTTGRHTQAWRKVFVAIGGSGHRCWNDSNDGRPVPAPKYTGICPGGHPRTADRINKDPRSCPECSPRFNTRYLITWTRNT
jgi:predicted SprT family Zn-dependent metalloprotease